MLKYALLILPLATLSCSHEQLQKKTERVPASDLSPYPYVQSCVRSLCGSTSDNTSLVDAEYAKTEAILYKPDTKAYQKIDSALQEMARVSLQSFSRGVKSAEILLAQPKFRVPPSILVLVNSAYYLKLQQKALEQTAKGSAKDLVLADFTGLSTEESKWVDLILKSKYYINPPFFDQKETLRNYLDRKYPRQFFKTSLPRAIDQCQSQVRELGQFIGAIEKLFLYCGKSRGEMWNWVDEVRLAEELKTAELLTFLRAAPVEKRLLARPWDWYSDLKKYTDSDAFKIAQRLAVKNEEQLQFYVGAIVQSCHQSVGSSIETAPSEFLRERAVANIKDIKAKAKKLIQFKNKEAQRRWEILLSSTWYSFPSTAKALENNILRRLNAEVMEQTIYQGQLASPATVLLDIALSEEAPSNILKASPLKQEMDAVTRALSRMRDLCKSYEAETLTDHIYASDGNVYLSWFTLKNPDLGYGIIAHELGHHVSHLMRTEFNLQKTKSAKDLLTPGSIWFHRDCVDRYHGGSLDGKDHPHSEEDLADYFAGQVLRLKGPTRNYVCPLIAENGDTYDVQFESDLSRRYAPAIFRLLHVEKTAGVLSESCSQTVSLMPTPACF
ncbi:MAG: hypothetical protein K2Q26_09385 [Bdellovibrionales bacterium]|nr:hypothetical protein [Bdellovibrionales bacterium]